MRNEILYVRDENGGFLPVDGVEVGGPPLS
jgi:hypothetical protein